MHATTTTTTGPTLDPHPGPDWTDAEWDGWFRYRQWRRDERRRERRAEFARAIRDGRKIVERPRGTFLPMTVWPDAWGVSLASGQRTAEDIADHVESREFGFGWDVDIVDPT